MYTTFFDEFVLCRLIDESKHYILKSAHPSGLSAHRGFFGCRCFLLIACNSYIFLIRYLASIYPAYLHLVFCSKLGESYHLGFILNLYSRLCHFSDGDGSHICS